MIFKAYYLLTMSTKPVAGLCFILKPFFLLILLFSTGASADNSWETSSSRYLEQLLKSNPQRLPELVEPVVDNFYLEREFKPLWSNEKGRLDRAYNLLNAITHAEDEGLRPSDYYLETIRKFWGSTTLGESVQLDLLLSAALYLYSNHVYSGEFKASDLDFDWHIENKPLDVSRLFDGVAKKESIDSLLNRLPPQNSAYQLLKKQLSRFRELEQQGGWQSLDAGPLLKAGVQDKRVVQLRQRLEMTGDLVVSLSHDIDIFDHKLAAAVKRYQARHGLMVDGSVGAKTRLSLNTTAGEKIRQILINMERWRWMPRTLGKRYLMVNMTGFELNIIENDSSMLTMPVIVGKAYRSTPSFSGRVSYMEYNPYWTIPTNMVLEDMLPRQINDASFLEKKSIRLYRGWGENAREVDPKTVDWKKLNRDHFPYWLRQDPGPKNSLGRIKFLFSNPYEIYLHGTPDKHLFNRVVRAFSSGCIRVQDPVRLAAYLLNDDSLQMQEDVLARVYLGTNQAVNLPDAVPIYLVYMTAWVDEEGSMNFRHDIYGRDTLLNSLFDG